MTLLSILVRFPTYYRFRCHYPLITYLKIKLPSQAFLDGRSSPGLRENWDRLLRCSKVQKKLLTSRVFTKKNIIIFLTNQTITNKICSNWAENLWKFVTFFHEYWTKILWKIRKGFTHCERLTQMWARHTSPLMKLNCIFIMEELLHLREASRYERGENRCWLQKT